MIANFISLIELRIRALVVKPKHTRANYSRSISANHVPISWPGSLVRISFSFFNPLPLPPRKRPVTCSVRQEGEEDSKKYRGTCEVNITINSVNELRIYLRVELNNNEECYCPFLLIKLTRFVYSLYALCYLSHVL